jgi:hypothetical protein
LVPTDGPAGPIAGASQVDEICATDFKIFHGQFPA